MRVILAAIIAGTLCVSCAGVREAQTQGQKADKFDQAPSNTYMVNVCNNDSSPVSIKFDNTQDASQQGATKQGQQSKTGDVKNKPNIAPDISPTIPVQ